MILNQTLTNYMVTFDDADCNSHHKRVKAHTPSEAVDILNATHDEMRNIECFTVMPVSLETEKKS